MNKLRVLSLFSGIGAFEKALANIGVEYDLVNYCEFDKYASKAYSLIHNVSESLNLGDITKVDENNLSECDLITYGFPCQSFSVQGKKLGFKDKEKGGLFFETMRVASKLKPKYLIAENVKNLVGHDNGNTFSTILNTLNDLGYNNYYKTLNSVDFGVPHRRERIFIISIRKDLDNNKFEFPSGQKLNKTVRDIVDSSCKNRHIKDSLRPYLNKQYHKEFKSKDGLIKVFDGVSQGYFTSSFSQNRIYSIDGVSPTITTGYDSPVFYEINGLLNGKERLLLQGFAEEDYNNIKDLIPERQIAKQAGNSISVNVLESIFKNLLQS